jgi:hypothetical protein
VRPADAVFRVAAGGGLLRLQRHDAGRRAGLEGRGAGSRLADATIKPTKPPNHQPTGTTQAKYFLTEAPTDAPLTPRVLIGATIWAAGWLINFQADNILIGLRRPGEKGARGGGWGCLFRCMRVCVGVWVGVWVGASACAAP